MNKLQKERILVYRKKHYIDLMALLLISPSGAEYTQLAQGSITRDKFLSIMKSFIAEHIQVVTVVKSVQVLKVIIKVVVNCENTIIHGAHSYQLIFATIFTRFPELILCSNIKQKCSNGGSNPRPSRY